MALLGGLFCQLALGCRHGRDSRREVKVVVHQRRKVSTTRRCTTTMRHAEKPVCRESRRFSVGANPIRPIGRSAGSNQGDSGGNKCVEVLWCNGSLLGDLATMQAGTRVNAEQASKRKSRKPTRLVFGEGRRRWTR